MLGYDRRVCLHPLLNSSSPQSSKKYMAEDIFDVGTKVINIYFYQSDTVPVNSNETGAVTAAWPLFGT